MALELLGQLERSKEYKDFEKLVNKVLQEQWNDAIYSGIINRLFLRYKDYFINRRGRKAKIRKEVDDEVTSIQDIRVAERLTRQGDRFILNEKDLNIPALTAFIALLVSKNMKSVASYYGFRQAVRGYLNLTANRGGQSIIELIDTPKPIKFRLSNKLYKAKIMERVSKLVVGLNKTSQKKLVASLLGGIKKGETKTQMIKRLQTTGVKIAKNRAKMIAVTETEAMAEYMRYETARINGVKTKVWETAGDERVCPACAPLDGIKKPIGERFMSAGFDGQYPPAHPVCRCSVSYDVNSNLCSNSVKSSKDLLHRIKILFEKTNLYTPARANHCASCVNPNAVWAGGESLVGVDKTVGNYYHKLSKAKGSTRDEVFVQARKKLTDEGYVQLLKKAGIHGSITSKIN